MNQQSEPRKQQVFSITTAATSQSEEIGSREKRYAISMGIRTLCFVGAVVTDGWIRWVLVAGAVFLPYAAVVLANSGVRKRGAGSPFQPNAPQIEQPKPRGLPSDD